MRAFPKPAEVERLETKTPLQRRATRLTLYLKQGGICACGCNRSMTLESDRMDSCTLDHRMPNKMGCRKQDADHNLRALRWDCNSAKGSKRICEAEGKRPCQ